MEDDCPCLRFRQQTLDPRQRGRDDSHAGGEVLVDLRRHGCPERRRVVEQRETDGGAARDSPRGRLWQPPMDPHPAGGIRPDEAPL
jgi:hypothetical protein